MNIDREPTKEELKNWDGGVLGEQTELDILVGKRKEIEAKFQKRNRAILINSKNHVEDTKKLSCEGCFSKMFMKDLASEDFEENFKEYQGRMKLTKISKTSHGKGDSLERGINFYFERCICGKKFSIPLESVEISKEMFDNLVVEAHKITGEDLTNV